MTTEGSTVVNRLAVVPYDDDYYSDLAEESRSSAEVVVPLIMTLVQPKSVIDVGCGRGEWLSVFRKNGVDDVWGVDGAYVNRQLLKIPEERFIPADLEQPLHLDRRFDLVVSLEVAEHLPEDCAEAFVNSLTSLGPLVLFSAAIPYQSTGGPPDNHINEQWPEYWAKLFLNKGYIVLDPLRRKIWNNELVKVHYAQNTLVFVAQDRLRDYSFLARECEPDPSPVLSIVHPRMYLRTANQARLRNFMVRNTRRVLRGVLPPRIYRRLFLTYWRLRDTLRPQA